MKYKYDSQTLAIVLVLLLIGAMVAFALLARSVRDAERTVKEKSAAESFSLVETTVDVFALANFDDVVIFCDNNPLECEGNIKTLEEFGDALNNMGITEGKDRVDQFIQTLDDEGIGDAADFCQAEMNVSGEKASVDITLNQDETYGVIVEGVCQIDWNMTESGATGFMYAIFERGLTGNMKYTAYNENTDFNYFNYDPNKIFTGDEGVSATDHSSGNDGTAITTKANKETEIRFRSLGGNSVLKLEVSNCPGQGAITVEVGVTCGGQYAGKTFSLLPTSYAPSEFDYVLFNGFGDLKRVY